MFTLKAFIPPAAVMWLGLAWIPVHAQTSWSGDLVDFTLVAGDLGAFGAGGVLTIPASVLTSTRHRSRSFVIRQDW